MRSVSPMMRSLVVLVLLAGCPSEQSTLPDESGDFTVGSSAPRQLAGTRPVTPAVAQSRWTFVEASCTEGTPDITPERTATVRVDDQGLLFIFDQKVGECSESIAQRFTPGENPDDEWSMVEEARVRLGACEHAPEAERRPADLRMRGQFLEYYVQRSKRCNGLEVKMVFAPAPPAPPTDEQLLRHYALHFNRRDARAITELFSDAGSLVEPFNRTPDDQPMRHDGKAQIYAWFNETFSATPWLALKVVGITPGQTPGAWTMDWHYMDPRLDVPFAGRNRFTIAAGEIFETTIEITQPQVPVEGLEEGDPSAAPEARAVEATPVEAAAAREGEAAGEVADPEAGDGD